jgi:hypothetical protein
MRRSTTVVAASVLGVGPTTGWWTVLAPVEIAPRICETTAAMADRMADWVTTGWHVRTEADLDRYTFAVAGAVGLLFSDLWAWHDGTTTHRAHALAFGRGLQAVNVLRNRAEDVARGADFQRKPKRPRTSSAVACRSAQLRAVPRRSTPCPDPVSLHHVQCETHQKHQQVPATQGLHRSDTNLDTSPHQATPATLKGTLRRHTFYPSERSMLITDLPVAAWSSQPTEVCNFRTCR